MDISLIIQSLEQNKLVFTNLLNGLSEAEYTWKPTADKWCLLEIICHLYDEEREDFRARTRQALETPDQPLKSIDPVGWVTTRRYMEQDYQKMIEKFLHERDNSIQWLKSLKQPSWGNAIQHRQLGTMSAGKFLHNWLAHDYLHFRQITRLKYQYLKASSKEDLSYAGIW